MTDREKRYKTFAENQIAGIYKNEDGGEVYALLRGKNDSFSCYTREAFDFEYVCLRLVIGCIAWVNGCRENNITDKVIQNAFFKSVMDSFASPEALSMATAFSEYFYSPDGASKNDSTIPLVAKMFERLEAKKQGSSKGKASPELVPCIKAMLEITESIRMSFENDFLEFVHF